MPAYLLCGWLAFYTALETAFYNHLMMEGAVARSSIGKRLDYNYAA